ncbi:MAG: hypothetical protein IPM34_06975 [Saprospiraceae bacterium]|nr:hypothetical protein [Saprospiraceae bacterium]
MEGKYTKIGTIVGILALVITIWQIFPNVDKKIDGEWIMVCKVREADLKKYVGLEIKWKLFITENNQLVKGTAEKIAINNQSLNYDLRTSMKIEGNIKHNIMTLNYIENGRQRQTSGIITATIKDKIFNGLFSQTASNTKGEITGIKVNK